ncbi:hypothetical protein GVAV_003112 [Gurleya vavrai]
MPFSVINDIKSKNLKPFNTKIDSLLTENIKLNIDLDKLKENANDDSITIEQSLNYVMLKNLMDRNTRLIKTYKYFRFKKIEKSVFLNLELQNMNEDDIKYKNDFNDIFEKYKSNFCIDFELDMPKDYYVNVIAIDECGSVLVDGEILEIRKGMLYYLRKKIIRHLLITGRMKII